MGEIENLPAGYTFGAMDVQYVDVTEAGIAEPAKVTRSAYQNAASSPLCFPTIEVVTADLPA